MILECSIDGQDIRIFPSDDNNWEVAIGNEIVVIPYSKIPAVINYLDKVHKEWLAEMYILGE